MSTERPPINFATLDLNLLKVFDVLMQERHLTRAADRLGKSVAGTSHALRRLREELQDDLFENQGRGMAPTRRALELASCIHECLGALRVGLTTGPKFDPKVARRVFTLDLPVGSDMILAGPLMAYAEKHAPNVTFQILSDRAQVVQSELRYGETDIAIDHEPLHDDGMHSELLYEDPFYLLSRRNHPGITPGSTVTHETFLDLSHIGLSWTRTKGDSPITQRLARSGFERDLRMKVPTIGAVGAVISQTNLVCAASLRVAQHFARLWPLAIHPLDINLPPVPIHMIWHSRFDSDPGHAWLRAALREAAATA